MPTTVNMQEAKTHLSKLVARAEEGEEIVIARAGKPVVSLKRWIVPTPKKRVLGTAKGKVEIAADFDEPIPELKESTSEGALPLRSNRGVTVRSG